MGIEIVVITVIVFDIILDNKRRATHHANTKSKMAFLIFFYMVFKVVNFFPTGISTWKLYQVLKKLFKTSFNTLHATGKVLWPKCFKNGIAQNYSTYLLFTFSI